MQKLFPAAILMIAVLCGLPQGRTQSPPPKRKAAATAKAGQQLFTQKCFQCHSVQKDQVHFGPTLYGEMKGSTPKKSESQIRVILTDGKGKMPSFQDTLTKEDMDNLIAYLRTL